MNAQYVSSISTLRFHQRVYTVYIFDYFFITSFCLNVFFSIIIIFLYRLFLCVYNNKKHKLYRKNNFSINIVCPHSLIARLNFVFLAFHTNTFWDMEVLKVVGIISLGPIKTQILE